MPAGRRHHDRRVQLGAEQAHAGVDLDDVAQHARTKLEPPPGGDVILGGDLIVGAGVAEHPRFRPHHAVARRAPAHRDQRNPPAFPSLVSPHHAGSCHRSPKCAVPAPIAVAGLAPLQLPGVFHGRRPSVYRRQAQDLPRTAQVRLLRHSQPVERRQRPLSAGPGLQGAGDHQLRPRPFRRLCRRRAIDRRRAGALPGARRRGDRHPAQRRFRERLCRRSGRRRRQRDALHRDRRGRAVDRGFAATLRPCRCTTSTSRWRA